MKVPNLSRRKIKTKKSNSAKLFITFFLVSVLHYLQFLFCCNFIWLWVVVSDTFFPVFVFFWSNLKTFRSKCKKKYLEDPYRPDGSTRTVTVKKGNKDPLGAVIIFFSLSLMNWIYSLLSQKHKNQFGKNHKK